MCSTRAFMSPSGRHAPREGATPAGDFGIRPSSQMGPAGFSGASKLEAGASRCARPRLDSMPDEDARKTSILVSAGIVRHLCAITRSCSTLAAGRHLAAPPGAAGNRSNYKGDRSIVSRLACSSHVAHIADRAWGALVVCWTSDVGAH